MTDEDALTLDVWGEARGEPIEGQVGVAQVVRTRVREAYRGATSYAAVCLAHAQFSAWTDEAAAMHTEALTLAGKAALDPVLARCREIAVATIAGLLADNTGGANHYYAWTSPTPSWAIGVPVLAVLGHHTFLRCA